MIKYQNRSRDLIGLYQEIKQQRLIPDAYFQRNLVWRDSHKQDFIKTILLGYPFPQIFVSKGKVNVAEMKMTSCIVDGQQRMNAIKEYIEGSFKVDGKTYQELSDEEKSNFLKYEIAVIELDLENTDSAVKEIFQRINRTTNALTSIEKLASEYAPSEFMFTCRIIADDMNINEIDEEDDGEDSDSYRVDPLIEPYLIKWARGLKVKKIRNLFSSDEVFTTYEKNRKVHLQHILNIVASILGGYYNRNSKVNEYLDDYYNFPQKEDVINLIEHGSELYLSLKFPKKSIWRRKSNFFSLFVEICQLLKEGKYVDIETSKARLQEFELHQPEDFRLAGQEAVNNTQQRTLRGGYVRGLLVTR